MLNNFSRILARLTHSLINKDRGKKYSKNWCVSVCVFVCVIFIMRERFAR